VTRRTLALDIGSTIGWARRHADGSLASGEAAFNGSRATKLAALANWLVNDLTKYETDLVIYERPFARGQAATRMGWGMAGVIEAFATIHGAAVLDAHNATVKKWATGGGNAGKEEMVAACWQWGRDPADEHEADALCVLYYSEVHALSGGKGA